MASPISGWGVAVAPPSQPSGSRQLSMPRSKPNPRGPPIGAAEPWPRPRALATRRFTASGDAHGLQPHRTKRFKLSKDPHFTEKLTDVVGLYLNPPDKAIVLCVDEKSQIQALQRTQPGLPMKKGRCGTMTHDYKRHGTTTLFAALNVLDGRVIGEWLAPAPASGVPALPSAAGPGISPGVGPASDPRQLWDAL